MALLKPIDITSMNTEWQKTVLRSETAKSVTVDITINPYYDFAPEIKANPNWRYDNPRDPALKAYLDPGVTTNWDPDMREELIRLLKTDGIDPDQMTDLDLVQAVSSWLFETPKPKARFQYSSLFIPYYLKFNGSSISVAPESRRSFDIEKRKHNITSDEVAISTGILGKTLFKNRKVGDCTASATLQATVLKALGIPTRLVVSVPLVDANHPAEIDLISKNMRDGKAKTALMQSAFSSRDTWSNHTFNEVWIGKKWTRLNYAALGQSVVDIKFLGVMVQTTRVRDWSEAKLDSWGSNFTNQGSNPGFSANPYRAIALKDHSKPATPFVGMQVAKISKLTTTKDQTLPEFMYNAVSNEPLSVVAILEGDPTFLREYRYLKFFLAHVSPGFTLTAPGRPTVRASINGHNYTDGRGFAAFIIALENPDDLTRGVEYTLIPDPPSGDYQVDTSSAAKVVVP